MTKEEKMAWAIKQLQDKYDEFGMLPAKSDFDAVTQNQGISWSLAESIGVSRIERKERTPKKDCT